MNRQQVAATAFDYASLDPDTAADARNVAARVRDMHQRTVLAIIDVGRALAGVKARVGHGRFGAWLAAEFGAGARTAQNYMAVAERLGEKAETISHLPPTTVYALAAPSTPSPVREAVVSRLDAGEAVTPEEIGEIVQAARREETERRRSDAEIAAKARRAKSPDARARIREREQARRDAELAKWKERAQVRSRALADLAALLADRLGPDLSRARDLLAVAEPYAHDLLAAMDARPVVCPEPVGRLRFAPADPV